MGDIEDFSSQTYIAYYVIVKVDGKRIKGKSPTLMLISIILQASCLFVHSCWTTVSREPLGCEGAGGEDAGRGRSRRELGGWC